MILYANQLQQHLLIKIKRIFSETHTFIVINRVLTKKQNILVDKYIQIDAIIRYPPSFTHSDFISHCSLAE